MTCLASCRPASECWIACFHSNDTIGVHVRVCAQMRIYVCVCKDRPRASVKQGPSKSSRIGRGDSELPYGQ